MLSKISPTHLALRSVQAGVRQLGWRAGGSWDPRTPPGRQLRLSVQAEGKPAMQIFIRCLLMLKTEYLIQNHVHPMQHNLQDQPSGISVSPWP